MDLLDIKGLGKVTKEELHNENINTIDELLFHFPQSYEIYEFNMDKLFTGDIVTVKGFCDSKPVLLKYRKNVYQIIFYANINGIKIKCILFSSDYTGSGALAMLSDILNRYGADSFIGLSASVAVGSTETIFYTLSIYCGAAGVKNARYALPAALISGLVGILSGIAVLRLVLPV